MKRAGRMDKNKKAAGSWDPTWEFHYSETNLCFRLGLIDARMTPSGQWRCVMENADTQRYWDVFYKHYDSLVYSYIPLSAMFVFNTAIIAKLLLAKLGASQNRSGTNEIIFLF